MICLPLITSLIFPPYTYSYSNSHLKTPASARDAGTRKSLEKDLGVASTATDGGTRIRLQQGDLVLDPRRGETGKVIAVSQAHWPSVDVQFGDTQVHYPPIGALKLKVIKRGEEVRDGGERARDGGKAGWFLLETDLLRHYIDPKNFISSAQFLQMVEESGVLEQLRVLLYDEDKILAMRKEVQRRAGGEYRDLHQLMGLIWEVLKEDGIDIKNVRSVLYARYPFDVSGQLEVILDMLELQVAPEDVPLYQYVEGSYIGRPPRGTHESQWAIGEKWREWKERYPKRGYILIRTTLGEIRKRGVVIHHYVSFLEDEITLIHSKGEKGRIRAFSQVHPTPRWDPDRKENDKIKDGGDRELGAGELRPIRRIAVMGGGVMGGATAYLAALRGLEVVVRDLDEPSLDKARVRIEEGIQGAIQRRKLDEPKAEELRKRIRYTTNLKEAVEGADIVFEAVFENPDVKRELFAKLDELLDPNVVVLTNTSSIDVDTLAPARAKNPRRVGGLHFFSPVWSQRIVEVVVREEADPMVVEHAMELVRLLDKEPVRVKNSPAFAYNRLFIPFFNEMLRMYDEGYDPATLDAAAAELLGPGARVFWHTAINNKNRQDTWLITELNAARLLQSQFKNDFYAPAAVLVQNEAALKEKRGLWEIPKDAPVDRSEFPEIQARLEGVIFAMAGQLVDEGIVLEKDPYRFIDYGARRIFGWRHGPLKMMSERGMTAALERVAALQKHHPTLTVPASLKGLVERNAEWPVSYASVEVGRGVGFITLDKPEVSNVLDPDMVRDLRQAFEETLRAEGVHAIVIRGAGRRAFVAGANLEFFIRNLGPQVDPVIVPFVREGQELYHRIDVSSKPVVALVEGFAFGGGAELALAADAIYVGSGALFALPETTRVGIYPGLGGTYRTTRKMGRATAKRLVLTGAPVNAKQAYEIGLADAPAEKTGELLEKLMARAEQGPISMEEFHRDFIVKPETPILPDSTPAFDHDELPDIEAALAVLSGTSKTAARELQMFHSAAPIASDRVNRLINENAGREPGILENEIDELSGPDSIFHTPDAIDGLKATFANPDPRIARNFTGTPIPKTVADGGKRRIGAPTMRDAVVFLESSLEVKSRVSLVDKDDPRLQGKKVYVQLGQKFWDPHHILISSQIDDAVEALHLIREYLQEQLQELLRQWEQLERERREDRTPVFLIAELLQNAKKMVDDIQEKLDKWEVWSGHRKPKLGEGDFVQDDMSAREVWETQFAHIVPFGTPGYQLYHVRPWRRHILSVGGPDARLKREEMVALISVDEAARSWVEFRVGGLVIDPKTERVGEIVGIEGVVDTVYVRYLGDVEEYFGASVSQLEIVPQGEGALEVGYWAVDLKRRKVGTIIDIRESRRRIGAYRVVVEYHYPSSGKEEEVYSVPPDQLVGVRKPFPWAKDGGERAIATQLVEEILPYVTLSLDDNKNLRLRVREGSKVTARTIAQRLSESIRMAGSKASMAEVWVSEQLRPQAGMGQIPEYYAPPAVLIEAIVDFYEKALMKEIPELSTLPTHVKDLREKGIILVYEKALNNLTVAKKIETVSAAFKAAGIPVEFVLLSTSGKSEKEIVQKVLTDSLGYVDLNLVFEATLTPDQVDVKEPEMIDWILRSQRHKLLGVVVPDLVTVQQYRDAKIGAYGYLIADNPTATTIGVTAINVDNGAVGFDALLKILSLSDDAKVALLKRGGEILNTHARPVRPELSEYIRFYLVNRGV